MIISYDTIMEANGMRAEGKTSGSLNRIDLVRRLQSIAGTGQKGPEELFWVLVLVCLQSGFRSLQLTKLNDIMNNFNLQAATRCLTLSSCAPCVPPWGCGYNQERPPDESRWTGTSCISGSLSTSSPKQASGSGGVFRTPHGPKRKSV